MDFGPGGRRLFEGLEASNPALMNSLFQTMAQSAAADGSSDEYVDIEDESEDDEDPPPPLEHFKSA